MRGILKDGVMKLKGLPLELNGYNDYETLTNKHFQDFKMAEFERVYLPECMRPFVDSDPIGKEEFVVDDNRGAIFPSAALRMDGIDFFLSVKGVGSATSPFSHHSLGKSEICSTLKDTVLKEKILRSSEATQRYITGELWLRGSPYGGQGLQHAATSMRVSEMADLTSIHGFRIAPLVKIVVLPEDVQDKIKGVFWYRRFGGKIVQETRLVPSNVRVYFHSGSTIGGNIGSVFDLFGIDTNDNALHFLRNFLKSGIAYLTVFTRSIKNNDDGTYSGIDFSDVWLDKDAVIAPDGTIFFVDLEGLEWITLAEHKIQEKIEDQIYRSLYEFIYAYEQIERERSARFGATTDRKVQFEWLLRDALKDDEIVDLAKNGGSLELVVGNILDEERIHGRFPILNW